MGAPNIISNGNHPLEVLVGSRAEEFKASVGLRSEGPAQLQPGPAGPGTPPAAPHKPRMGRYTVVQRRKSWSRWMTIATQGCHCVGPSGLCDPIRSPTGSSRCRLKVCRAVGPKILRYALVLAILRVGIAS